MPPSEVAVVRGRLFEAASSRAVDAALTIRDDRLVLDTPAGSEIVDHDRVEVSSRVGSIPRRITLADGRTLETPDNDAVDRLFAPRPGHGRTRRMATLERPGVRLIAVILALIIAAGAVLRFGIPILADLTAWAIPRDAETLLGEATLKQVDGLLFQPSRASPTATRRTQALFAELVAVADLPYAAPRLVLRDGAGLGANALALPGGVIVVTDQLLALLGDDDDAVAGVIAHELGHARERHGLRLYLRAAGLGLVTLWLTGDILSLGGLAIGVTQSLATNAFARDFEAEADSTGADLMRAIGRSPAGLARALEKLSEKRGGGLPRYLSSHPPTPERIDAINRAAR